jgi:stearoyl-CoA desaturase (delta-9 desaturase)
MNQADLVTTRAPDWKIRLRPTTVMLLGVHLVALVGVLYLGWSWQGLLLALVSYYIRMVVVTGTYHRYFSHRSFQTSRVFQFLMALAAQTNAQNGVLWWASHHRSHHRYSDKPKDVHSAKLQGFWYAHWGWILGNTWNQTDQKMIVDLYKYPELRLLNHPVVHVLPTVALALAFLVVGGLHGLVWGYFVSTVLVWHGSFSINSLAHKFGRQRYATGDESRNNWLLAILMTGEGWHNNHHHYPGSARQGFHWWELDVTFLVLRLLALTGLIWNLRSPPQSVIDQTLTSAEIPIPSQQVS